MASKLPFVSGDPALPHPITRSQGGSQGKISLNIPLNSGIVEESAKAARCSANSLRGNCLEAVKNKLDRAYRVYYPRKAMQETVEMARIAKLESALHLKLTGIDRGTGLDEHSFSEVSRKRGEPYKEAIIEKTYKKFIGLSDDETLSSEDKSNFEYQAAQKFINGVFDLAAKIELLDCLCKIGIVNVDSVDGIRKEMSDLMGPLMAPTRKGGLEARPGIYETLADCDHPAVNFLQILSIKIHAADGEPILSEKARQSGIDLQKGPYPMGQLADAIKGHLKQFAPLTFNHDRMINKLWWAIQHPKRAYHSFQSEQDPLIYNPNQGNPSYLGPRFERSDGDAMKTMQAYYGPSPTGDRVFEFGLLPAYRKFGIFEIYFNYQDTTHAPEKARIEEIQRIAAKPENKDCLKHVVLGFDAKIKNPQMQDLILNFKTVAEFFQGYESFVMKGVRDLKLETGFAIPQELLSDAQLKGIFASSREFFLKMGLEPKLNDPKWKKKDLAEMMIMDIDARIASAIIYQQLNRVPDRQAGVDKDLTTCYVSARCKQHIDRGAVQSNALRLYFRMFEDDSYLTQREFEEISGGILGRAPNVENRNILFHRYKRFDSLMRLIGDNHADLAMSLRDYRDRYLKV